MTVHSSERPSIIGTGLIALDLVIGPQSTDPAHAWTGGTCGNVLTILGFLGWDAFPIARMNGDPASQMVQEDMAKWGVHLDFAAMAPTCATPIIVQVIRHNKFGEPSHRFSWNCPHCGSWLPGYKAVTAKSLELVLANLPVPRVYFLDRLSRAALVLAEWASQQGALVVFEPSGKLDPRLLKEALTYAHVVKYSNDRIDELAGIKAPETRVLLEIRTEGSQGLSYRRRAPGSKFERWIHLPALQPPRLVDTCGAGDWATAGLISKCGDRGLAGFLAIAPTELREVLQYAQALSAWNCGFEGARGGMYQVDPSSMTVQVEAIRSGKPSSALGTVGLMAPAAQEPVLCPACPQ